MPKPCAALVLPCASTAAGRNNPHDVVYFLVKLFAIHRFLSCSVRLQAESLGPMPRSPFPAIRLWCPVKVGA